MQIRRRNEYGFTIVELMIVVAVIGLLVALAIPHALHAYARAQRVICEKPPPPTQGCRTMHGRRRAQPAGRVNLIERSDPPSDNPAQAAGPGRAHHRDGSPRFAYNFRS